MPPKKRSTVQPSSRVTRSSTKSTPQRLAGTQSSIPAPPLQPSSASMSAPIDRNATGPRKRKQVVIDPVSSGNSEPELEPDGATMGNSQSRHKKRRQQEPPAAKPTKKSSKKAKAVSSRFDFSPCRVIYSCHFSKRLGDFITDVSSYIDSCSFPRNCPYTLVRWAQRCVYLIGYYENLNSGTN